MRPESEAWEILDTAEQICSAVVVSNAVRRLADEITAELKDRHPLVLSVMGGAVIFSGQLLPLLRFPLELDYIHASRYRNRTQGEQLEWKVLPKDSVAGRIVLVVDDILDEGHTLAAIRDKLLSLGAAKCYSAVFAEKSLTQAKPVRADFVGLTLPDRYVFGFGMDVYGLWRNLPAIYALRQK
ncbi:MAG TPA: hypoxanthine-guanine phosphoribosyltransferase [Betaproteobacteria bacterium]|nr:hypoxanthine-guanine phosphoribosyltransferase [Betaproteobacteria bacterium]